MPKVLLIDYSTYGVEELEEILTNRQKAFCQSYILDWNGTRAAKAAGYSEASAITAASDNIRKPYIKRYIDLIKEDIAGQVGISKIGLLKRLKYIAEADLLDIFDDWITRVELNILKTKYPGLSKAIKETSSKVVHKTDPLTGEPFYEEYLKVQMHDPMRATELIFKAMGWNEPEKLNLNGEITTNIDITNYTPEERLQLLKLARKTTYQADE